MTIKAHNISDGDVVHTPLFVIHGECLHSQSGVITVKHKTDAYPPLFYEVNYGYYKAIIHLDPGVNDLILSHSEGTVVNGYPQYTGNSQCIDMNMSINYQPLDNKPIHLCLLVAKDSPGYFDTTSIKGNQEGNGIDLAVRKLRVAARLMQAFTNEQMLRAGFGQRTFNFAEETAMDTLFEQEQSNPRTRRTIKIHVIRSKRTLQELRDPNLAQQNSRGTDTSGLFRIALEELKEYSPLNSEQRPLQAAVLFLDTHWDPKLKLILAHASLGGGNGDIRLAISGSHGLFSWPASLEKVVPAFQDDSSSNINEVANDCNVCGTNWECFNVTMGSFLHQIGRLFGCPRQVSGIMFRDFVYINRSFATRETRCLRTWSLGRAPLLQVDECGWHRLDMIRFLHHPSFALPSDQQDPTFGRKVPRGGPSLCPLGSGTASIRSASGVYAIEVVRDGLAVGFLEYSPRSLGGRGVQHDIFITLQELQNLLPPHEQRRSFDVRILAVGGEAKYDNIAELLTDNSTFVGFEKGKQAAFKSGALGNPNSGIKLDPILFDPKRLVNIRVYWGAALDGIRFDEGPINQPPVMQRDPESISTKMLSELSLSNCYAVESHLTIGNPTLNYSDFQLQPYETIKELRFRSGAWIDAVQIITSTGRMSEMLGNKTGGGEHTLSAPPGFEIVGIFGSLGSWLDSIGIIYAPA
jgi:hypothetical protein